MSASLFLYPDENAWIKAQKDALKGAIEAALGEGKRSFHACLSGGRTPKPVYEALAADQAITSLAKRLDLHLWVGDERALPEGHEDRNDTMIRHCLGGVLDFARFHPWPSGGGEPACREYRSLILALLGAEPVFDFAFLGMGADGHTAGIFSLRDAAASGGPIAHPSESPAYPKERMTLAAWVLRRSSALVVGLRGKDKKEALEGALAGKPSPIGLVAGERGCFHYLENEGRG